MVRTETYAKAELRGTLCESSEGVRLPERGVDLCRGPVAGGEVWGSSF